MRLQDTANLMISADYKERFRAEYFQVKTRLEGLVKMLKQYKDGTLGFKPSCTYSLLNIQKYAMNLYKSILEERAKVENISLDEEDIVSTHWGE